MELVIYSPKDDEFLTSINFNNAELKKELAIRLEKYNGLVYTEDSIRDARADRAALNKFKTAIETRRIEIKKRCLRPYEDFEKKVKELVDMVDKPILAIDKQVKAYDQARKDEKEEGIKQFYTDKVADLKGLVSFEKIFNPRWLNVTYKEADIQKEITDLFIKVEGDLAVIAELQSEHDLQIKDVYLRKFDLTAALQEKKRLEERAAKMAAYKQAQREKKQLEHAAQKPQPQGQEVEQRAVGVAKEAVAPQVAKEEVLTIDFRVWATKDQLDSLRLFLQTNDIRYGRVPEPKREAI